MIDTNKGPLQIIAELIPAASEENRLDIAHDILIALNRASYVIHRLRSAERD